MRGFVPTRTPTDAGWGLWIFFACSALLHILVFCFPIDSGSREGSKDASRLIFLLETGKAGLPPVGKTEKRDLSAQTEDGYAPDRKEPAPEAPPVTETAIAKTEEPEPETPLDRTSPAPAESPGHPEETTAPALTKPPQAESRSAPALSITAPAGGGPDEPDRAEGAASGEPVGEAEPVKARFGTRNGPKVVRMRTPEYPFRARRLRKEGNVLLELHLDAAGKVQEAEVIESAGYGFDESALKAVERSKFSPATRDGQPVACLAMLPVRFALIPRQ